MRFGSSSPYGVDIERGLYFNPIKSAPSSHGKWWLTFLQSVTVFSRRLANSSRFRIKCLYIVLIFLLLFLVFSRVR